MNVVLCEYAEKRKFTAGNKARTDVVKTLIDSGYKHVPLFRSKNPKVVVLFQMLFGSIKAMSLAEKDDIIFLQYPYYPAVVNKTLFRLLRFGRKIKNYRICLLIHDVVGLRRTDDELSTLKKEVAEFNKLDMIICHNDIMAETFKKAGFNTDIAVLGAFDYLCDENVPVKAKTLGNTIVIAGNLAREKCGYVYQLDKLKNCRFNLYGVDYDGVQNENIQYKGKFQPDELVSVLDGNFGLVWDGESLETCTGVFGNYLRYNNPHKFSLYIVAGIPLIVWEKSALSEYVKKHGIGICVNSLEEIDEKLKNMTEPEYQQILDNISKIRNRLMSGENLKTALNSFEK